MGEADAYFIRRVKRVDFIGKCLKSGAQKMVVETPPPR